MKIQIKNRFTGNVIFELDEDENSMLKTVMEAIKQGVDLRDANLSYSDLRGSDLSGSDLSGSDLSCSNLRGSDLRGSNLRCSNLSCSNLSCSNLSCSNLRDSNLSGSDLSGSDLRCSNLRDSNLRGSDLSGSDLRGSDLNNAKNIPYVPLACPSDGAFTAWKKVKKFLVELYIPEEARRSSATTNKCRCDKAKVISITDLDTNESVEKATNDSYAPTVYEAGCWVTPDSFDENRWNECSHGIHFFINKQEAINY